VRGVVKLQGGDPVSLEAWGCVRSERRDSEALRPAHNSTARSGANPSENPSSKRVVGRSGSQRPCLVTDDGAVPCSLEGVLGKDAPLPVIVQKARRRLQLRTNRLAAIRYRLRLNARGRWGSGVIYVTDAARRHFAGVFSSLAARPAGFPKEPAWSTCLRASARGVDGKEAQETRAGDNRRLRDPAR